MQCVITEATEIIEVILAVVGQYEADAARFGPSSTTTTVDYILLLFLVNAERQ